MCSTVQVMHHFFTGRLSKWCNNQFTLIRVSDTSLDQNLVEAGIWRHRGTKVGEILVKWCIEDFSKSKSVSSSEHVEMWEEWVICSAILLLRKPTWQYGKVLCCFHWANNCGVNINVNNEATVTSSTYHLIYHSLLKSTTSKNHLSTLWFPWPILLKSLKTCGPIDCVEVKFV